MLDQKKIIKDSALSLFMRLGIRSVSMDDLARELSISKKTLYNHYDSKGDLVRDVMLGHLDAEKEFCATYTASSLNSIEQMLTMTRHVMLHLRKMSPSALHDLRKYYPETWKLLEAFLFEFVRKKVEANLIRGMTEGLYREDLDSDIVSKLYAVNIWNVVNEAHFPLTEYHRDELYRNYVFYHMHGIVADKGKKLLIKFKELMQE